MLLYVFYLTLAMV